MKTLRLLLPLFLVACGSAPPSQTPRALATIPKLHDLQSSPGMTEILAAPDRSAEDRALDGGRRPGELFAFAGVKPGMSVAEIGAWEGYTAELLARVVAPGGTVYAQDPPDFDKYTHATWEERAKRSSYARIVRWARPFDAPFAPDAPPLDVVFCVLFYHDTVWLGVDRAKMNAAIYKALKPGGTLVVVDHSARAGDGIKVAKTLHRIEESVVKEEILKAGFVLEAESEFLRHADDKRDWSASDEAPKEKRGTSDRFALRFKKP